MKFDVNSIKIVRGFLTKEACERLIKEHQKGANHKVNIEGEKSYRYSNPEESDFLDGIEMLLKFELEEYIKDNHINDFPNFKAGDFKLMEYQEGDWFVTHYDGDFSKWPEGGYKYHPFTTDIALNSWHEYKGGEFHINGKVLKLNAGDLVIFPSSFSFPHGVKMLSKGNRYVLVSEPYSLDWGLQEGELNVEQENKCAKVNQPRESLFSRCARFFRRN